ncbi:hypothetical protein HYH03_007856 [Edaphochlamys debaryana]|uniref:HYR domain-containing protein n=1 Tax=Edaphochlamys debaryana TaxID=47281 RepID=A0A835Y180_9CHLO|nr:hypothetical protein HYH03_007856 [Edaphochlamys debaryana]|eukprot:KAG2493920.1 hypothetical protein HYH03_007856 [Edaphochlamys debaryana]
MLDSGECVDLRAHPEAVAQIVPGPPAPLTATAAADGSRRRAQASAKPTLWLIQDTLPWNLNKNYDSAIALGWTEGVDFFVKPSSDLFTATFPEVRALWFGSVENGCEITEPNMDAAEAVVRNFVAAGGTLIVDLATNCNFRARIPVTASTSVDLFFNAAGLSNYAEIFPQGASRDAAGDLGTTPNDLNGLYGSALSHGTIPEPGADPIPAHAQVHLRSEAGADYIYGPALYPGMRPIMVSYTLGNGRVILDTLTKEFYWSWAGQVQANLLASIPINVCPAGSAPDLAAPATSNAGATVSYNYVGCNIASGSVFPIGVTSVTCSSPGCPDVTFTVTVKDLTAPVISARGPETAEATSPSGAVVNYARPSFTDNVDGTGTATCTPAPGSLFPLGPTTVTCTAEDAAKNKAVSTTFIVSVVRCSWTAFLPPINNLDDNVVTAVQTLPVKWNLGGDYGVSTLIAPGFPKFLETPCDSATAGDTEAPSTAEAIPLKYDPITKEYNLGVKLADYKISTGKCYIAQLKFNVCPAIRSFKIRVKK